MKKLFALFPYALLITGCASNPPAVEANPFQGATGCFLLYNVKKQDFEKVIGGERCQERFPACSTFKVPLAVIAFDDKALKDENQTLKWKGEKGPLETHHRDQNAKTWMKESVVWFSQRLTPKIGKEKIEKYLKAFGYGNADLSGGITEAWLVSPAETSPALRITAYEQVEFMKKLWNDELPASKRSNRLVREITFLEKSPKGYELSGKTGSNFYEKNEGQDKRKGFGWFVGHLQKGDEEYIAVANLSDTAPTDAKTYGGPRAKQIVKDLLKEAGLW